jgi:hypothetical protein
MSPCCAITAYQHNRNVEWLPHIRDTSPEQALEYFRKLYAHRESPLGKLCQQCDWWILFKQNEDHASPYLRIVPLPPAPELPDADLQERPGAFLLNEATVCNTGTATGEDPVCITTPPEQWAFAAVFPMHDNHQDPLEQYYRLVVRVEATVDEGRIGVSLARPDLSDLMSKEEKRNASPDRTIFEVRLNSPRSGSWLVVRNYAADGVASRIRIHGVRTYVMPAPEIAPAEPSHEPVYAKVPDGFVPLEQLSPAKVPVLR